MMFRYLSVCSGIEAPAVAWHPMGWRPLAFSEIAPFPCAVLAHHYPDTPNLGDLNDYAQWPDLAFDLLVGGTPCQSFSIAGGRRGLADTRGSLALAFLKVAERYRPRWLVWENVPGVLSSSAGRDFSVFIEKLAQCGYGFAWRVLDAQFFGVPQRRRRLFLVGHSGNWRCARAVLFEREGLCGHPAPRPKKKTPSAPLSGAGAARHGGAVRSSSVPLSFCLNAGDMGRLDLESETLIAFDYQLNNRGGLDSPALFPTLRAGRDNLAIAGGSSAACQQTASTLTESWCNSNGAVAGNNAGIINPILYGKGVRRLTPRECERLQGFPDDYTQVPLSGRTAADTPRYRALGNSMAVPVVRWIGERIARLERTR